MSPIPAAPVYRPTPTPATYLAAVCSRGITYLRAHPARVMSITDQLLDVEYVDTDGRLRFVRARPEQVEVHA